MIDRSQYKIIERTLEPLSLAVHPQDRTTRLLTAFGAIRVSLENFQRSAVKNPSGYFIYLTLEDGDYTVAIDSDYYLGKKFTLTLSNQSSPPGSQTDLDDEITLIELQGALLAEVRLIPNVNYPFPSGATLVRGEVVKLENSRSKPLPGAIIHVTDLQQSPPQENELLFKTSDKGRFVLYMNKMTKELIKEINGKEFNGQKVDGQRLLLLRAVHPDFGESSREVLVKDGKTVTTKIQF